MNKKHIKTAIIISIFFLILTQQVFSLPLEELVSPAAAGILRNRTEPVTNLQTSSPSPVLVPKHEKIRNFVNENINKLKPSIFIETLSLYSIPERQGEPLQDQRITWSAAEQNELFNQLTAIGSLAGIQYYSQSNKAMKTFYETSCVVDGPSGKKMLPDPKYAETPVSVSLYARQKDLTFGNNIYLFNYHTSKDSIYFMQENLTTFYVTIIPAVGKNNLKTIVAVIDAGDSLLIYAAAMAKTASMPGMGDRIAASFTNRINAILKWFTVRADMVFVK